MRIRTGLTLSVALGLSTLVHGQGRPTPPASTNRPRFVAIGCVSRQGTAASPRYVITDTRGDRPTVYRLQGDAAQLGLHVGHTVEVSGTLAPPAAGSSQYLLKVASLAWVSSSCRK